jgi:tetratricopeptide (TPR) repeat protein
MPQLLPRAVHALAAAGSQVQAYEGAVMFADLSGFTPLCDALMAGGDEGAEQLADTLASVFDPLLHAIGAHGGDVLAFAGDSVTAGFTGMADPLAAAAAAGRAALDALSAEPARSAGGQHFTFSLRVGVAGGRYVVGLSRPPRGLGVYWVRGPAVARAVSAQQRATRGALLVDGPAPAAAGLVFPLPVTPDPAPLVRAFVPAGRIGQGTADLRHVVTAFLLLDGVEHDDTLRRALAVLFAARNRFGAHILDLGFADKGAALVLTWGADQRHENDVERALSALLHLRAAWASVGLPPFRVGVTRRRMFVGLGGGTHRRTLALYGRGVALAARIAVQCAWGEILTDAPIARGAARSHTLKSLGGRDLKGFAEPVPVYRLLQVRSAESTHTPRGLMIGRAEELAAVEGHLATVRGGGGGVLRIEGEAGVGKTLLIDSLQARNQAGMRWVRLSCDEVLRGPLNPVVRHLRALTGQQPGAALAQRRARFDRVWPQVVGPAAGELTRARVFIEGLLGLEPQDPLWHELSPALRGANTLEALKDLVRGWCRTGPVVVVVDDVQWADAQTSAWLQSLTRNVERWPLMLLCVARPDTQATPLRPDAVVVVEALPATEFEALIETRLGRRPDPELARYLQDKTAGNPFFAEQLCAELVASGRLELGSARAGLLPGDESAVPLTVADVCVARIDRLSAEARGIVQAASVLGRRFPPAALAGLLDHADPDGLVVVGVRARMWTRDPDGLCTFRHGLLRDAAYGMLLHARRRELHGRAARALLAVYAGGLDAHAADIAAQLEDAGEAGEAVVWWVRAVEHAEARYAMHDVVLCADRAVSLAHIVGEAGQARAWDAVAAMADALGVTGARDAGARKIERVLADPLRRPPSDIQRARIDARLSRLYAFAGRPEDAVAVATRALESARAAGYVSVEIDACKRLGVLLGQRGDPVRAREVMEEGLALAERTGDLANQGSLRNNLLTLRFAGGESLAVEELDEAVALARAAGDRVSLNNMLANIGTFALMHGDVERGRATLRESLRVASRLGQRPLEAHVTGGLGQSYLRENKLDKALTYLQRGLELAQEAGNVRLLGAAWVRLAAHGRAAGQPELALGHARSGLECAERSRYLDLIVHTHGEAALCLLDLGRAAEAAEALVPARAMLAEHELRGQVARHRAVEALVAQANGDLEAALVHRAAVAQAAGGFGQDEVRALVARLDAGMPD